MFKYLPEYSFDCSYWVIHIYHQWFMLAAQTQAICTSQTLCSCAPCLDLRSTQWSSRPTPRLRSIRPKSLRPRCSLVYRCSCVYHCSRMCFPLDLQVGAYACLTIFLPGSGPFLQAVMQVVKQSQLHRVFQDVPCTCHL